MQAFGRFVRSMDIEYLVEQYVYIPLDGETIDTATLKEMLQNKRKSVAGTIFLYNPTIAPIGYNTKSSLASQGYEFDNAFCELSFDSACNLFSSSLKDGYRGKLVEIKYFFGINRDISDNPQITEHFEIDIDRYYSNQLTIYDQEANYQDVQNIRLSGKFVFFASGNKFDKQFKNVVNYIKNTALQAKKVAKEVVFLYDNNYDANEALELGYFLSPFANAKLKDVRANAFKKAFSTNPPTSVKIK